MEDIHLLEIIEKYLSGQMSDQEIVQLNEMRQNSAHIDQLVVEHKLFLDQIEAYAKRKNIAHTSHEVFNTLLSNGEWTPMIAATEPTKVIVGAGRSRWLNCSSCW